MLWSRGFSNLNISLMGISCRLPRVVVRALRGKAFVILRS
ncbi:hypothetical protein LINPERHAP1_LOCUS32784 [Linum perenne]